MWDAVAGSIMLRDVQSGWLRSAGNISNEWMSARQILMRDPFSPAAYIQMWTL